MTGLAAAAECLLFVAGEPLSLGDLTRALACSDLEAEAALRDLQLTLGESGSGLQIVEIANGWQLCTRPEHAESIARLLTRGGSRLSRAGLETLAIVAYRQPVTVPEIEAVRGVASSGVIKTLLDRRLIVESGRRQTAGRPILYATTRDFLHFFGLMDLSELPPLDESERPPALPAEVEAVAPAAKS